jgi:hypothetical protein
MKTFGAGIVCSICSAQPYPDNPTTTRESFDLALVDGSWFCEQCRPAKVKSPPRPVVASPIDALGECERQVEAASAGFRETLVEDLNSDLASDFKLFSDQVARACAEAKKAVAPQKPPPDAAPASRAPKQIRKVERLGEGQADWVGDVQPAVEGSP